MKTFLKPLTISEERLYLEQLKQGEQKAKDVLVERNMRLVAHIVKKYSQTEYEMEDLISIGTIGLIKAVDTFNPDRANRLGTYAAKCIDNAILSQMRLCVQNQSPCVNNFIKPLPLFETILFILHSESALIIL